MNNQGASSNPQQNRPMNIQPAQANRLIQELRNEWALAKAAGDNQAEAQQHYRRAEQIKQVLIKYHAQRNARQQQAQQQQQPQFQGSGTPSSQSSQQGLNQSQQQFQNTSVSPGPQQLPQQNPSNPPLSQQPTQQLNNNPTNTMQQMGAGSPAPQSSGTPQPRQGSPGAPNNQISIENFNQVKSRMISLDGKIKQLNAAKNTPNLTPEQLAAIDNQLNDFNLKLGKCQQVALIIREQLTRRNAALSYSNNNFNAGTPGALSSSQMSQNQQSQQLPQSQQQSPINQTAPSPAANQINPQSQAKIPPQPKPKTPLPKQQPKPTATAPQDTQGAQGAQPNQGRKLSSAQLKGTPGASETPIPRASATTTPNTAAANAVANNAQINKSSKTSSPAPSSKGSASQPPGPPAVNLAGITKPSVPPVPISNSINVKPPNPVTLKPGGNNTRATLTGGSANGFGQVVGTPAVVKMPTFDLATTGAGGPIPDNNGRVLTKRKLTELVNTIGADEGDGKTNIDGDVEELLLDLADEFITSVTGFACRLAKHRKVDSVDVRDVQLHLERNWNIRIPGYAMDEIRATRKWQPSSSYNQKVSGVEISKSVNGNIN
ncbi:hypothetical protein HYPBUDRAFT_153563 [Hyphopichia burtonii NRRL Y-1933]|uniref:TBP-associated factor 12 n=1 Tax=Hyphopichia burtonii NRRL Y-1933 TaxID=984485 RepID=A0A1E4RFI2_9ASCO|nr:hypothetical protein HYPBUDRAFT_153563 [Hyphopichia burtonii NRRL Y-1933]ODV66003.1 hypothetical protein HYPBUDRAFT_153563 [Hyphopichia burtonii NRRL Y-1933]